MDDGCGGPGTAATPPDGSRHCGDGAIVGGMVRAVAGRDGLWDSARSTSAMISPVRMSGSACATALMAAMATTTMRRRDPANRVMMAFMA
ncbi:hypothetical protein AU194_15860 [Mycobacterium sp. GA-2829]|nr:hypothetical protein AU194_15860 [Mycobacterium sp. GA-2829]